MSMLLSILKKLFSQPKKRDVSVVRRVLHNDVSYVRSNSTLTTNIVISPRGRENALRLLKVEQATIREKISSDLLDELSRGAKIANVKLSVLGTPQQHRKKGGRLVYKRYGFYTPATQTIVINNVTAVRGQILASKTFLETLLHEWMHHYDLHVLKIRSLHTAGFYMRIRDVKLKLGL